MVQNKEKRVTDGTDYEGKDKVFLDEDRIINEGLSGGKVYGRGEEVNIEEARDLTEETPPYESK